MPEKDMIKVGLIGCGRIAMVAHLPALRSIKKAVLAALADSDEERLMKASSRFGVKNVHRDYRKLLENKEIDAILLVTPTYLHAEMALDVLDAGKHLYVEKPLVISIRDAKRLVEKWSTRRLKAMIGFNFRFSSLYQSLRHLIHEEVTGKILSVRSVFSGHESPDSMPAWKLNRDTGGGILLDLASHHIDLFRYLFDCEIKKVFAKTMSIQSKDDSANVFFETDNGVSINSFFSSSSIDEDRIEIYGEKGKLLVDRLHSTSVDVDLNVHKYGQRFKRLRYLSKSLKSTRLIRDDILTSGREESYALALEHFIDCIRKNKNPKPDLFDGIKSLSIVIAANESANSGTVVKISNDV